MLEESERDWEYKRIKYSSFFVVMEYIMSKTGQRNYQSSSRVFYLKYTSKIPKRWIKIWIWLGKFKKKRGEDIR